MLIKRRLLTLSLIVISGLMSFAQVSFTGANQLPRLYSPYGSVTADFNGDGKLDMAVVNNGSNSISVFTGTGSGTFGSPLNYATGSSPKYIAVGTLDGNNFPDLVVTNYSDNSISVYINSGNGSFAPKVDYVTGGDPNGIAIADFNNDSKLDIVVANYNEHYLSILTNTGTGSFSSISNCTTAGYPYSVAVGDFNGDNKNDLAVAFYYDSDFSVITGTGTGKFGTERLYGTFSSPAHVAIGDFNIDGKADVAVVDNGNTAISIFTGTGSGTLGAQKTYTTNNSPLYVAISDYNTDGKPDLAVVDDYDKIVSVLLNTGTGTFNSKVDYAATSSESIISGDFNTDGKPDLIISTDYTYSVLLNSGTGAFNTKKSYGTGDEPQILTTADFNGDGKFDMASTNYDSNTLSVSLNDGYGNFGFPTNYDTGSDPWGIASADFNGDSKTDIVYVNNGDGNVSVILNNGDGTFGDPTNYSVGTNPVEVTVADFNVDGKIDIAVGNYTSNNISILINAGSGTFGGTQNYTAGTSPRSLSVGYFDSDNKPDLAVANYGETSVSIMINNGSGAFPSKVNYTTDYAPFTVVAGELSGDNRTDFAVTYYDLSSSTSVHINNGDGTFATNPSYFATGSGPKGIAIGDLNGDSKNDIITTNYYDDNISVLINTGSGSFKPKVNLTTSATPSSVSITDFTGDAKPDILTVNYGDNYLSLYKNSNKFLIITVNNATRAYNTPNPTFTSSVLGLDNGDQVIVTYTTTATATSGPGQYPIIPIISFIGSDFSSYALNTISGTLTINAVEPDLTYTGPTSGVTGTSISLSAQSNSGGAISYTVANGTGASEITGNSLNLNTPGSVTLSVSIAAFEGFSAKSIQVPITITSVSGTTTTTGTVIITGNNVVNIYIWGTASGINLINTNATGSSTPGNLSASVSLASGVSAISVKTYFREISSKGSFTSISGSQNDNTYTATLDPTAITALGLEYYFEIDQGNGSTLRTDTMYVYINFTTKVAINTAIKTGSTIKDYQILSFPYVFTSNKVKDVLSELGAADKSEWRLFSYENGSSVEKLSTDSITLGRGYWLITKKGLTDFNSDGKVPLVKKSKPVSILLNKGWNLLGNPYAFNVSWADVSGANPGKTLPASIFTYSADGTYAVNTILPKFSGAWVFMADSATIKIPVIKNALANGGRISAFESLPGNMSSGTDWETNIEVSQGDVTYKLSGIGMRNDASEKADNYDIHVLPRLPQYADISMVSSDNQLLTRNIVKSADTYTWNMALNSDNNELPATLSWNLPSGVSLILEDGSGNKVNMNQVSKVALKPGSSFKIHYGSSIAETGITISSPTPNPAKDNVLLNLTLPEDGAAELKVIGLTGVSELSEKKVLNQGLNSFYVSTDALAAGLHVLQVNVVSGAKAYSQTFKIVITK